MSHSLQHPYWRTVENPRLAQRRAPEPAHDTPSLVPPGARVLRALDDEAFVGLAQGLALDDVVTPARAEQIKNDLPPGVVYSTERRKREEKPAQGPFSDSLHEPAPLPLATSAKPLKPREGHSQPKSRSKWKRTPGTYGRFTSIGATRERIVNRFHGETYIR